MKKSRVHYEVDADLLEDFDKAAELNRQNRAVYLRVLMVDAVRKAQRSNPELFNGDEK